MKTYCEHCGSEFYSPVYAFCSSCIRLTNRIEDNFYLEQNYYRDNGKMRPHFYREHGEWASRSAENKPNRSH